MPRVERLRDEADDAARLSDARRVLEGSMPDAHCTRPSRGSPTDRRSADIPGLGLGAIRNAVATCAAVAFAAAPALAQPELAGAAPPASGADVTRPDQRIDLRIGSEGKEEEDSVSFILRHDRPVPLGDGWQANLRIDLPFTLSDAITPENRTGTDFGFGDILVQAVFVRPVNDREGFGFGAQMILPTASGEAFGRRQWRLRPTAGYRWLLPEISEETFFQLLARYDFSFAGNDDRGETSELQFAPNLEIGLPGRAYFSIFPSADIRYDFERDEFFLPLNLEVGKSFGRVVASLEGGVGLISGENPPYDWKLEARIGFRF